MARIRNADKAVIPAEKVRDYLLCATHPHGHSKAELFRRFGYSARSWEVFAQDLRGLILCNDVTASRKSRYGQKFSVRGQLTGPNGKSVQVITVWIILNGDSVPRLVTVYAGSRGSRGMD